MIPRSDDVRHRNRRRLPRKQRQHEASSKANRQLAERNPPSSSGGTDLRISSPTLSFEMEESFHWAFSHEMSLETAIFPHLRQVITVIARAGDHACKENGSTGIECSIFSIKQGQIDRHLQGDTQARIGGTGEYQQRDMCAICAIALATFLPYRPLIDDGSFFKGQPVAASVNPSLALLPGEGK
ncbi:unnamed protein product [Protopolystoma xenopodis]|uniref:Uncharacterized protein n=1 Tax=Protopolystoma xenopodis TaxID=117903 RepID=A0A448WDJ4_9PLAT|nr:unnamed protein product [Protopolystoma xenopodis]